MPAVMGPVRMDFKTELHVVAVRHKVPLQRIGVNVSPWVFEIAVGIKPFFEYFIPPVIFGILVVDDFFKVGKYGLLLSVPVSSLSTSCLRPMKDSLKSGLITSLIR